MGLGLDFNDPEWTRLLGGYRTPYDPRNALRMLEEGRDTSTAWAELWTHLHHQGDVGEASYAAVPHLVRIHVARRLADWNTYALIATIEEARQTGQNPKLPPNLRGAYEVAWHQLVERGLVELSAAEDPTLVTSIIGVLAMGKGQFSIGRFVLCFTESERRELLTKAEWVAEH